MIELPAETDSGGTGAPAWVMTFADLMSLLMCFFVLLLSFSEMDAQKYKQVAGSMKFAFGVQRKVDVRDSPKGTSIIAREFSPGRPSETLVKVLRQETTDDLKDSLDTDDSTKEHAQEQADALMAVLHEEIEEGLVELRKSGDDVLIRIRERGSFPSGSAELQTSFHPVLAKIGHVLSEGDGRLIVSGHTDDVPIATARYPSNWELSAGRASSVVHHLTTKGHVAPNRIEIRAHADTAAIAPNNTPQNRAKNRRVEIVVTHGKQKPSVLDGDYSNVETIQ